MEDKHLEHKIRILNEITGNPVEPYTTTKPLSLPKHNVGHYYFAEEYDVFNLFQIDNENGKYHQIFYGKTREELWLQITAYMDGVILRKNFNTREVA